MTRPMTYRELMKLKYYQSLTETEQDLLSCDEINEFYMLETSAKLGYFIEEQVLNEQEIANTVFEEWLEWQND